jgi:hypothetical protein
MTILFVTSGDSLSYAFIGFDTDKASEDAYFKMNNVLIDDRRIKVSSSLWIRSCALPPSIAYDVPFLIQYSALSSALFPVSIVASQYPVFHTTIVRI